MAAHSSGWVTNLRPERKLSGRPEQAEPQVWIVTAQSGGSQVAGGLSIGPPTEMPTSTQVWKVAEGPRKASTRPGSPYLSRALWSAEVNWWIISIFSFLLLGKKKTFRKCYLFLCQWICSSCLILRYLLKAIFFKTLKWNATLSYVQKNGRKFCSHSWVI